MLLSGQEKQQQKESWLLVLKHKGSALLKAAGCCPKKKSLVTDGKKKKKKGKKHSQPHRGVNANKEKRTTGGSCVQSVARKQKKKQENKSKYKKVRRGIADMSVILMWDVSTFFFRWRIFFFFFLLFSASRLCGAALARLRVVSLNGVLIFPLPVRLWGVKIGCAIQCCGCRPCHVQDLGAQICTLSAIVRHKGVRIFKCNIWNKTSFRNSTVCSACCRRKRTEPIRKRKGGFASNGVIRLRKFEGGSNICAQYAEFSGSIVVFQRWTPMRMCRAVASNQKCVWQLYFSMRCSPRKMLVYEYPLDRIIQQTYSRWPSTKVTVVTCDPAWKPRT